MAEPEGTITGLYDLYAVFKSYKVYKSVQKKLSLDSMLPYKISIIFAFSHAALLTKSTEQYLNNKLVCT